MVCSMRENKLCLVGSDHSCWTQRNGQDRRETATKPRSRGQNRWNFTFCFLLLCTNNSKLTESTQLSSGQVSKMDWQRSTPSKGTMKGQTSLYLSQLPGVVHTPWRLQDLTSHLHSSLRDSSASLSQEPSPFHRVPETLEVSVHPEILNFDLPSSLFHVNFIGPKTRQLQGSRLSLPLAVLLRTG